MSKQNYSRKKNGGKKEQTLKGREIDEDSVTDKLKARMMVKINSSESSTKVGAMSHSKQRPIT
ncbi:MAG: hypothetical protein QM802_22730 [Agriterribacter sp.]